MSLAGLLELADREFQAVQDDDDRLREQDRSTVQAGLAEVVDLQKQVEPLETQIRETQERRPDSSTYVRGSARALIDEGYYLEAVRAYDRLIESHPGTHTNYIGRARARFLAGDAEGARADLTKAEEMYPFDPVIERLKLQIREATPSAPASAFRTPAQEAASQGNNDLSIGNAPGAFASYTKAEALGWSSVYSKYNRAMALCLADEADQGMLLLDEIQPDPDSFMEINVSALRCLCAIRGGKPFAQLIERLQSLERLSDFEYWKSPIRFLEMGLQAPGIDFGDYAEVFRALDHKRNR